MILAAAVFLSALGFLVWALGLVFDMTGVAAIGAVLIVGVGAMAVTDGLEARSGEVRTQVDNNTTEVTYQYQPVETPNHLPLGQIVMLLGGLLMIQSLNSATED